jgi:F0F1-type ATP synthase assembly protein I
MLTEYKRLVWIQSAALIIGAGIVYLVVNPPAAKSLVFGSCVALLSTLLLAWRQKQGKQLQSQGAEWALKQAYRTEFERFLWTAVMLAVGFGKLKLAPLWLLAGFVGAQAAWLLIPIWIKLRKKNDN